MIIALAICTNKQMFQFVRELPPEFVANDESASHIAGYALDNLAKQCDPTEVFTNAMVNALRVEDQEFATLVRNWIYKHLEVEPTSVSAVATGPTGQA